MTPGKRIFDVLLASFGMLILWPLFLVLAIWIRLDSPGPVFFRQVRVGRNGKEFRIFKFRTMVADADKNGMKITVYGDRRITRSGRWLRRYKLDELPQLFNVIKGEMSLVGPRPEVPEYIGHYPESAREVILSVPPGLTDFAAIEFRNENELLANCQDPRREYVEKILPIKIKYYLQYVAEQSLFLDFRLIVRTLLKIIR
ncbi:sugar transferase [Thiovibrio sp. JS02]